MSVTEQVVEQLKTLSEAQIKEVAEYVAFLKFRTRKASPQLDEKHLAALYAEFADEDRNLAEEGMAEYAKGLAKEDVE